MIEKLSALLLCLTLAFGLTVPAAAFADVPEDAPYAGAVEAVAARGLMTGVSENGFSPDAFLTRAMAVVALHRLAGSPAAKADSPFTDLELGSWYAPALSWAWENGIAKGVSPTLFAPNVPCTVQESAVFLHRYARYAGLDASVPAAAPVPDGASPWAAEAAAWAAANGLMPHGAAPTDGATRGGFAVMLNGLCDMTEPPPEDLDDDTPSVGGADVPSSVVTTFPGELSLGSSGDAVRTLQTQLAALGYAPSGTDGTFDNDTAAAVRQFQADLGLYATGTVDELTWAALFSGNSGESKPFNGGAPVGDDTFGREVVDYALQWVGVTPYVWAGNSLTSGTDSSGFVHLVYEKFGINVPRTTYDCRFAGYEVSYAEAMPGDIICYDGHVALYIGGGAIVHATDEASGTRISYDATFRPILTVRRVL